MSKFIGFAITFAFLLSGTSVANAAGDGAWVTCKDGMKMHSGADCSTHGGELIEMKKTKPIDTTKALTPKKATTTKQTTSTGKAQQAATKKRSVVTARCNDGAMYQSTERRGACGKHGGVRHWL